MPTSWDVKIITNGGYAGPITAKGEEVTFRQPSAQTGEYRQTLYVCPPKFAAVLEVLLPISLYASISPIRTTHPTHLILLDLPGLNNNV